MNFFTKNCIESGTIASLEGYKHLLFIVYSCKVFDIIYSYIIDIQQDLYEEEHWSYASRLVLVHTLPTIATVLWSWSMG